MAKRIVRHLSVFGLGLGLACALAGAGCGSATDDLGGLSPFVRPAAVGDQPVGDEAFLAAAFEGASVVALGESIHLTEEFPTARLPLVRFLHEKTGFDVLAFEGSPVDHWIVADEIRLAPVRDEALVARAQRRAWYGLWQTASMREVMAYIVSTQGTGNPL